MAQLQAMNSGVDLKSTTKLVVPSSGVRAHQLATCQTWYNGISQLQALTKVRARKGDTIASIAAARNLDANEVARLNGVTPEAELRAGQEIRLPATAAAPSRRR